MPGRAVFFENGKPFFPFSVKEKGNQQDSQHIQEDSGRQQASDFFPGAFELPQTNAKEKGPDVRAAANEKRQC